MSPFYKIYPSDWGDNTGEDIMVSLGHMVDSFKHKFAQLHGRQIYSVAEHNLQLQDTSGALTLEVKHFANPHIE